MAAAIWKNGCLRIVVDFYTRIIAYTFFKFENVIQIITYLVLLPYMEITLSHTVLFQFQLIPKPFL